MSTVDYAEHKRFNFYQQLLLNDTNYQFVGGLLKKAAEKFSDRPALITQVETVSFASLYNRAARVTFFLREKGIKVGDRVCILIENSVDFYVAYYGAWQVGAVVAPLNTFLHENELAHIIKDAEPAAFMVSSASKEKVKKIISGRILLLSTEQIQELPSSIDEDLIIPYRKPDDLAALLYTSGTTGVPKGVMLSSRAILTNIAQGMARIDVDENDRVFGVLPFFHSFAQIACVWGNFFVGCSVIIVPKIDRRAIIQALIEKPTIVLGVPALYALFCLMKTVSFQSVRVFVSGGDALPDKIRSGFEIIYRRKICNGYGMTETSPLIAVNFDDDLAVPNTVGRPVLGLECSIRDEYQHEVVNGATGNLWVKGNNVMLGYYQSAEQTAAVMQDGWLNTGDCAFFDSQGRLVISGRERDIIKNKGLIIYPQEIENSIMHHRAVMKVAVVGKKDESVGEIPVAFVAVNTRSPELVAELKKLCSQHLAPYKIPRIFYIEDDLPMTTVGKIDKKKLRERLADVYITNDML